MIYVIFQIAKIDSLILAIMKISKTSRFKTG